MPLPFILAGAAIAAGAFGIKKGLDAKSDMDKAKRVTESANEIGRKAQARLENQQEDTKAAVEGLGRTKIEILSGSVNDFINNFKKINSSLQLLSRLLIAPSQCLQGLEQCA